MFLRKIFGFLLICVQSNSKVNSVVSVWMISKVVLEQTPWVRISDFDDFDTFGGKV